MAVYSKDALKAGDKIVIPSFEAVVVDNDKLNVNGCTQVRDQRGYVHYVYYTQINKAIPYADGGIYLDSGNTTWKYTAAVDPLAAGTWQRFNLATGDVADGTAPRAFNYPSRPLRTVAVGTEDFSD